MFVKNDRRNDSKNNKTNLSLHKKKIYLSSFVDLVILLNSFLITINYEKDANFENVSLLNVIHISNFRLNISQEFPF